MPVWVHYTASSSSPKHVIWSLVGVNVSVDGCLSLYVSRAMNWRLVQGDPRLHPMMLRWAHLGDMIDTLTGCPVRSDSLYRQH